MSIMADVHSHILPGIDDGSQSIAQTMLMLNAARQAGISSIIATPHVRDSNADMASIREVFNSVRTLFEQNGVSLRLGYEVNVMRIMDEPDIDLRNLRIEGTNAILLEMFTNYLPLQWENTIEDIQRLGIDILIAHPERYIPIQQDISIAQRMVDIGCELQVSANSLAKGMLSKSRKCALNMLKKGLIHYIASDAHCEGDYPLFAKAINKYGGLVKTGGSLIALR